MPSPKLAGGVSLFWRFLHWELCRAPFGGERWSYLNSLPVRPAIQISLCAVVGFVAGMLCLPHPAGKSGDGMRPTGVVETKAPSKDGPAEAGRAQKLRALFTAPSTLRGDVAFGDALEAMKAEDFSEMFGQIETLMASSDFSRSGDKMQAILDRWFEISPAAAKDWAQRYFTAPTKAGAYVQARFLEWLGRSAAKADPQWALENLLLKHEPLYANPNGEVMEEAARRNPALAAEWMLKLDGTPMRQSVRSGYIKGLASHDPVAAMDQALAEKNQEGRRMAGSVVAEAAKQSAGLARQVLGKITDKSLHRDKMLVAVKVLANETATDPFSFIQDELGPDLKNLTVDTGGALYRTGLGAHS